MRRKSREEIYSCCERGDEVIRCERRGCRGERLMWTDDWLWPLPKETVQGTRRGVTFYVSPSGRQWNSKGLFLDQFPILNHAIEISIGWIWKKTLWFLDDNFLLILSQRHPVEVTFWSLSDNHVATELWAGSGTSLSLNFFHLWIAKMAFLKWKFH